jgi:hypothetical protein
VNELELNFSEMAAQHFRRAVKLSEQGLYEQASDALVESAIALERDEDWRKIPALWEGAAVALHRSTEQGGRTESETPESIVDFRTMNLDRWRQQKDVNHRMAWAYQWAAERRLRANSASRTAHGLFLKAASCAWRTRQVIEDHDFEWPFHLYERALINFATAMKTAAATHDDARIAKDGLEKCARQLEELGDCLTPNRLMIRAYRGLKIALAAVGNLEEASAAAREESKYISRLYISTRQYGKALFQSLSGHRFVYFVTTFFVALVLIFPVLYLQVGSLSTDYGSPGFWSAFTFSFRTALIMGNDSMHLASSVDYWLTIPQTVISYFSLAVLVARLTDRTNTQ